MAAEQGGIVSQESVKRLLPGRRLRDGREQAGLSEEEVARRLHMSVTFVRAIEADDYERLPEAAFIRGYMRNYARHVGVPAEEVANLFQQMIEEDTRTDHEHEDSQPARSGGGKRGYLTWVVPLVLVLLALGWWLSLDERDDALPADSLDTVSLEQGAEDSLPEQPAPATAEPADGSIDTAPAELEVTAASEAAAPAITPDQLRIAFNGPCWVQVLDASGETLFSGQRDGTSALLLSGLGPFRITFGNGAAVDSLVVNDKSISVPPSAPGNVVRVTAP